MLAYNLKKAHGITIEEYQRILILQKGVCAICKEPPASSGRKKRLYVDHCHETDAIRGLLCCRCNLYLGMLETGRNFWTRASEYVEKGGTCGTFEI